MRYAGETAPHPNAGCVLTDAAGAMVAEGALLGQGGTAAEVQAATAAAGRARGGTAFLNLEPMHGELAGDDSAVEALVGAGVGRVVVGLRHPLSHLRGKAIRALREAGVAVDVMCDLVEDAELRGPTVAAAASACARANVALLHLAATGRPFSVLKYAMTLDGKVRRGIWGVRGKGRGRGGRQGALRTGMWGGFDMGAKNSHPLPPPAAAADRGLLRPRGVGDEPHRTRARIPPARPQRRGACGRQHAAARRPAAHHARRDRPLPHAHRAEPLHEPARHRKAVGRDGRAHHRHDAARRAA